MIFEFSPHETFNFITTFAEEFNIPSTENLIVIPGELGIGSVRRVQLSEDFLVLLHHYKLNEDLVLRRLAPEKKTDRVTMLFYRSKFPNNTFFSIEDNPSFQGPRLNNSTIEISSNDLNSTTKFPANTDIHFTVVAISTRLLYEYLYTGQENEVIKNIINGTNSSFLYHERMFPKFEKVLEHLNLLNLQEPLGKFYFKLKVEELLYHLFNKLLKRKGGQQQRLSNEDVIKIHAVKNEILTGFSKPPILAELANSHGFSQTKMKSLFKQVYGDTIYNYFQSARMDEAAFLLQQSDLSVSEIGYRLGFTNLSHFSRMFKKYYNYTPKKYSSVG